VIGRIKGIQSQNQSVDEAKQGEEVAISIEGVTVGRQIKNNDVLFTDIPEEDAKKLRDLKLLNIDERDVLEKIFEIKRKTEKFWGM
jgi:translation initiation factor 5B